MESEVTLCVCACVCACCQNGVIDGYIILYHSHRVNNEMLRANDISCWRSTWMDECWH